MFLFESLLSILSTSENPQSHQRPMAFPGLTLQYLTAGQEDRPYVRRNVAWDISDPFSQHLECGTCLCNNSCFVHCVPCFQHRVFLRIWHSLHIPSNFRSPFPTFRICPQLRTGYGAVRVTWCRSLLSRASSVSRGGQPMRPPSTRPSASTTPCGRRWRTEAGMETKRGERACWVEVMWYFHRWVWINTY